MLPDLRHGDISQCCSFWTDAVNIQASSWADALYFSQTCWGHQCLMRSEDELELAVYNKSALNQWALDAPDRAANTGFSLTYV